MATLNKKVLDAVSVLSRDGLLAVDTGMVIKALGADGREANTIRAILTRLAKDGAIIRIDQGAYISTGQGLTKDPGVTVRIWRVIRAARPGWTVNDICQATRVSQSVAYKYIRHLLNEGYVAEYGRKDLAKAYRATAKAKQRKSPLHPPVVVKDEYEAARKAALTIIRAMMTENLETGKTRRTVAEAARRVWETFRDQEDGDDQS